MKLTQTQLKKMIMQEMKSILTEAEVNEYESISKKVSDAYRLIVEAHDELRQMKGPKKDIAKLWKLVDSIDNLNLEIDAALLPPPRAEEEPDDHDIEVDDFGTYSNPRLVKR